MTKGKLSERWLIEAVIEGVGTPDPPLGPGDDAAVIGPSASPRVVTTDALVEGVHFLRAHPPAALGWKSLAVNLSDVAAMGARPEAFVLSAAVPEGLPATYWTAFARGLGACARWAGVALVGGDTVRSPGPLSLTITAWGRCEADRVLTRSGGRAGDRVMVMGRVGRSALGLRRWLSEAGEGTAWAVDAPVEDPVMAAHLAPRPRLDAGPLALRLGATAGMDLSDGLATDLPRLARSSALSLVIDLDRLPDDPALDGMSAPARAAGGEDYGLLILAPPEREATLAEAGFWTLGVARQSREGAPAPVLWRHQGRAVPLEAAPFAHF